GDAVGRNVGDVLVLEEQPPCAGLIDAADQVENRRLAGAVWADDGEYLALVHLEADRIDRTDAAKTYGDFIGSEDAHRRPRQPHPSWPGNSCITAAAPSAHRTFGGGRRYGA